MRLRSVLFAGVVALVATGVVEVGSRAQGVADSSTVTQQARGLELAMMTLQQQAQVSMDSSVKDSVAKLQQTNTQLVDLARQIAALQCAGSDTACARSRTSLTVKFTKLSEAQQLSASPIAMRANQSKLLADAVTQYVKKLRDAMAVIVQQGR